MTMTQIAKLKSAKSSILIFLNCVFVVFSCSSKVIKKDFEKPERAAILNFDNKSSYIKAHMMDGNVYVLSEWNVKTSENRIYGKGDLLDNNRKLLIADSALSIALDSVALIETNIIEQAPAVQALTLITAVSVALTIYCAANPKACFGSCPTFYVTDEGSDRPQAEGFSSSIAPSLEARDIDALFMTHPSQKELSVVMKNEALETQVVRYVNLLAAPFDGESRILVTSAGDFRVARDFISPVRFLTAAGDRIGDILAFDGVEFFSESDSTDLATRELIEIEFSSVPEGNLGLAVASRQSLLSTFLFYQTLAYMGNSAGDWIAALQRSEGDLKERFKAISEALGKIEVYAEDSSGQWLLAGEVGETGPLATDIQIVELPPMSNARGRVKLRLARGCWRLDYIALARLESRITPLRLEPKAVYHEGELDQGALSSLTNTTEVLTMLPGDEYAMIFDLPDNYQEYEYFLDTRGYYLEWIREEWLKEENPNFAAQVIFNPEAALKTLAAEFKKVEAEMEETFWNSRYEK